MYQKEIIYMALHKDGSRLGSAGFLKVENRDQSSSLYLKVKNIPHSIHGRFPVRFYNGADWKEVDGITLQEGSGLWEESESGVLRQLRLQIILPGGYLIEGISKEAQQKIHNEGESEKGARKKDVSAIAGRVGVSEEERRGASVKKEDDGVSEEERRGASVKKENDGASEEERRGASVKVESPSVPGEERSGVSVKVESPGVPAEERRDVFAKVESPSVLEEERKAAPVKAESVGGVEDKRETMVERIPVQRHRTVRPATIPPASDSTMVSEELPAPMADEMKLDGIKEDKWEQILDTYDQIHPYGDERVYVKLEPKDFVILQEKYQHLVNNSFLLHGFYNYRYVILGKENDYYLGVPGVFYDREKMVALMFGFEAFECHSGEAKPGDFGYYLRKVEL